MISFKIRAKDITFWFGILLAIMTLIAAYAGISMQEINTWGKLFDMLWGAMQNPYVVVCILVSAYNAVIDPTTRGLKDSERALAYKEPGE